MTITRNGTTLLLALVALVAASCGRHETSETRSVIDTIGGARDSNVDGSTSASEVAVSKSMTGKGSTTVVQYDDGNLRRQFPLAVGQQERFGVWFSPTGARPCRLNQVSYRFDSGSSVRRYTGLIYRCGRPVSGINALRTLGTLIDTFALSVPKAGGTVESNRFDRGLFATNDSDLFVAFEYDGDSLGPPILGDTAAPMTPIRSYALMRRGQIPGAGLSPLTGDLAIRAWFDIPVISVPPITPATIDTIVLRWSKAKADLDLYVIRNGTDTIYWGRRSIDASSRLDVDVVSAFGPETIVCAQRPGQPESLRVAVFYHAPKGGPPTMATVLTRSGGVVKQDTCVLTPSQWWDVESRSGAGGAWSRLPCQTRLDATRAMRRKNGH